MSDVDGVLTDSGMYYDQNGNELKKFNTRDGKGFELLRNAGIKTAIITSEDTRIVSQRAKKLKVDYLYQGSNRKQKDLKEICEKEGIPLANVAYIGDDVNDLEALQAAGFSACPSNADDQIIRNVNYVCNLEGGAGCFRELANLILLNYE